MSQINTVHDILAARARRAPRKPSGGGEGEVVTLSSADIVKRIRAGFAARAAADLIGYYGLDDHQAEKVLGCSMKTLARRLKAHQPLDAVQSDRVYRVTRVGGHAEKVFEDAALARDWMVSPNRALAGSTPIELLDTDAGAERVDEILYRIEHGIFG